MDPIQQWKVETEIVTLSDHKYITFRIESDNKSNTYKYNNDRIEFNNEYIIKVGSIGRWI